MLKRFLKIVKFITNHPLSRRHKVKALYKFMIWQVSQAISERMVTVSFIGKTKLWAKKGMEAATANIYTGLHEFNEMAFLLHFLRPSDVFVDVGANIGAYTVLASGVNGAHSISIEPVPQTYELLSKNISLNNIGALVQTYNIGVGSSEKILRFTVNKDSVNHVVLEEEQWGDDTIKVQVRSLDSLLMNCRLPALIKIDVEGFEQEVINGAKLLLQQPALKAVIIELIGAGKKYGFDETEIHNKMMTYGFNCYNYDPFTRKLSPSERNMHLNTMYVRDLDFVTGRVVKAKPVKIFSEKI